jgi:hypothetical protein
MYAECVRMVSLSKIFKVMCYIDVFQKSAELLIRNLINSVYLSQHVLPQS